MDKVHQEGMDLNKMLASEKSPSLYLGPLWEPNPNLSVITVQQPLVKYNIKPLAVGEAHLWTKSPDQHSRQRQEETCGVAGNIFNFFFW